MKILVTGALGFVGSNLCRYFTETLGAEVFGIDNRHKLSGSDKNLELIETAGVKFLYCDLRNQDDVNRIFVEFGPFNCIYHMAAQVAFKVSVESPRLDFEINALGTFNLLEAFRIMSSDALFVYASTNQVYGELKEVPVIEHETRFDFLDNIKGISEVHRVDFLSPYGCSKGAGDMYTQDYGRVYNLNTVVTRFGGIYGPHQYSYEDHGWISYITDQVRRNNAFNRFGHGKQVRDVLFIDDIMSVMHKLCDLRNNIENGACYNIGGGKSNSLSVLELLSLLEELTGHEQKSIINPMRKADKLVVYLDISKAAQDLDWQPTITYKDGIKKLIAWQNSL